MRAKECAAGLKGFLHSCFHLLSIFSLCLALSSPFEHKNTVMAIISSVTLHLWTWHMLPFIPSYSHHTQSPRQLFSSFVSLTFHLLSNLVLSHLTFSVMFHSYSLSTFTFTHSCSSPSFDVLLQMMKRLQFCVARTNGSNHTIADLFHIDGVTWLLNCQMVCYAIHTKGWREVVWPWGVCWCVCVCATSLRRV